MIRQLFLGSLLLPAFLLAGGTCSRCDAPISEGTATGRNDLPYFIHSPDTVIRLPKKLTEISGLTWLGDGQIGAVNDEDGDLFMLDGATGVVLAKTRFAGAGDYEGVERAGGAVFVLRSDGRLYELRSWQSDDVVVERHETGLKQKCDAEGLTYEPVTNSLLIACKEYPGKNLKGKRAVYRYALESGSTAPEPALVIDALEASLTPPEGRISKAVRSWFKVPRFKPSGIAVHPLTGQFYILSYRSNGLAVFDSLGQLLNSSFLDPNVFQQPEGIAFAPDATLYLSSEGRPGAGILARFEYRPAAAR